MNGIIDAVLTYHTNPYSCGVSKFNLALAKRLGIRCLPLLVDVPEHRYLALRCPLVSIKPSELPNPPTLSGTYDLFLHGALPHTWPPGLLLHARRIFAGNHLIAHSVHKHRPDAVAAWCPSTLQGSHTRGTIDVLLFGMSHKIDTHTVYVERLRDLLTRSGANYTVSVSTAVHEGSPWDRVFARTSAKLEKIFGDKLRVLGYLGDDALIKALQDCTAVALFFDPAARANNTTLWAAMEAGCAVITNLDADSPQELVHLHSVLDISRMTDWPWLPVLIDVEQGARKAAELRSWDKLLEVLR